MNRRESHPDTVAAPVRATVAISMLRALLAYLAELGHSRAEAIRAAGLEPAALNYPARRVDGRCFIDLMRHGIEATANPLLGLEFGIAAETTRWGTLGRLLRHCDTLGEALAYQRRYAHLVNAIGQGRLGIHAGHSALIWQSTVTTMPALVEEALAAWVCFARWASGRQQAPRAIHLAHRAQGDPAIYRALFDCPVTFSQPASAIVFDPAVLDMPLGRADAVLSARLQGRMRRDHAADRSQALVDRLDHWLAGQLVHGVPELGAAAAAMNLGDRALQQRLQAAGTHYRARIAQVRQHQAERFLNTAGLSIGDIALRLGFSEQSAFQRAFRRWYGMPPLHWRRRGRPAVVAPSGPGP